MRTDDATTLRETSRGVLVLRGSQAEKAMTVPACAGYGLSDLRKAPKGSAIPGEALVEHHHPFQFALPLTHQRRPWVEVNPVARPRPALPEGIAGKLDRVALQGANRTYTRLIEIA
jgi:hypothetical protein